MDVLYRRLKAINAALITGICFLVTVGDAPAQENRKLDNDWTTRGIENVKDVRSYCVYLDTFIPYAFQSERQFMASLFTTTKKENLDNASIAANWNGMVKSNAEIWSALGCAQILYSTNATLRRPK